MWKANIKYVSVIVCTSVHPLLCGTPVVSFVANIQIHSILGVQAAYWEMVEEGIITQKIANLLLQSVDEALDLVSEEPLSDWICLKANVHFPNYYKFLQIRLFPQKLVTYFTVGRIESACYICSAFLRAHRISRRQLHEFIGKYLQQGL